MIQGEEEFGRVRFHGLQDLGIGWSIPRALELAENFSQSAVISNASEAIELYNVKLFLESGISPLAFSEEEVNSLIQSIDSVVARFFSSLTDSNFSDLIKEVEFDYHQHLLILMQRYRAINRCSSAVVLPSLDKIGVRLPTMLENKAFVQAYGPELRLRILQSPKAAEYVIQAFLQKDQKFPLHFPAALTPEEFREMLKDYIESSEVNLNHLKLVISARDIPQIGLDPKLKVLADERWEELHPIIFSEGIVSELHFRTSISASQKKPVVISTKRSESITDIDYIYSEEYLEKNCDHPSILHNFQHLFGFTNDQVVLTFPSYPAQLGLMEEVAGFTGIHEYKIGINFQSRDRISLMQIDMYLRFLESKNIRIEKVIAWFFESFLVEEFDAQHFSFIPSDPEASYLYRLRHLFPEIESVVSQFNSFSIEGVLNRKLLDRSSQQIKYEQVGSSLEGKYLYVNDKNKDIRNILRLLFSNQSMLNYISEELRADNAMQLIGEAGIACGSFEDYHKPALDYLMDLGILEVRNSRICFVSVEQVLILKSLFDTESASYHRLSAPCQAAADDMVKKGWILRRSSLLTKAESDYFDYFLNRATFSNGENLRNDYLHGSQKHSSTEKEHHENYLKALRLMISLVIKINDEFTLLRGYRSWGLPKNFSSCIL